MSYNNKVSILLAVSPSFPKSTFSREPCRGSNGQIVGRNADGSESDQPNPHERITQVGVSLMPPLENRLLDMSAVAKMGTMGKKGCPATIISLDRKRKDFVPVLRVALSHSNPVVRAVTEDFFNDRAW
jgi:hypothetical protein